MRLDMGVETAISAEMQRASKEGVHVFVTGAVVARAGFSLLLVRRSVTEKFLPGYFEVPGGCVRRDEPVSEAVARELFEETGLYLDRIVSLVGTFDYSDQEGILKRQLNFLVSVSEGAICLNPDEHNRYFWARSHHLKGCRSIHMSDEVQSIVSITEMLVPRLLPEFC